MFKLKIVGGDEAAAGNTTEFRLPPPPAKVVIGRDPRADWNLADRTLALSARHCEVIVGEGWAMLRDISTNGTYVNSAPIRMPHDHALNPGDSFEIGPYRIEVQADTLVAPVEVDVTLDGPPPPPPEPFRPPRAKAVFRMRAGTPSAPPPSAPSSSPPPPAPPVLAENDIVTSMLPVGAPPKARLATDPMLAALAGGLGLEVDALAGRDPVQVAQQMGALARAAVIGLRRLLEQEARARKRLGSRQATLHPARDASPLRQARTPEDALLRLLDGGPDGAAALRRAGDELASHHEHLMVCFAGAARRLAQDLDPAMLDQAVGSAAGPAASEARHAKLWELYASLWHSLGQDSDETWARGFIDAAMVHLAAAYDEGEQDADVTRVVGPVR